MITKLPNQFSSSKFLLPLIWILTIVAFSPSLKNQFTNWDDQEHLTQNHLVDQLDIRHIKEIFTSHVLETYIPLTLLSYAVEVHFFGKDPFIFHLDNLILHLVIVTLIYHLAVKMGLSLYAAFWAALLFAVHPMHVESVAWVTERKDVLYSVFYLLAMYFYWQYLQNHKPKNYFLTHVFCLLSMLAKSMALTLPLNLLVLDWFYGRRDMRSMVLEKIPYLLYVIPIAWLTFVLNQDMFAAHQAPKHGFLIFIWTATFYIQKFFWPVDLSPVYEVPQPIAFGTLEYWVSIAIFAVMIASLCSFNRIRLLRFAFLFYLVSLFFLFRFSYVTDRGLVADRFMYLPSLGFCFLVGLAIDSVLIEFRRHSKTLWRSSLVVILCVFAALGLKTFKQCRVWENSMTLWNYAIEHVQDLPYPYNNRANAYLERSEYSLAIADYQKALSIFPAFPEPYSNLGIIYTLQGNAQLALENFDRAILLLPDYAENYYNRGVLYDHLEKYDLALADYVKAIQYKPGLCQAYNNRGIIYLQFKKYDLAINDFTEAINIDPTDPEFYNNRGVAYRNIGQNENALHDFNRAAILNHKHAKVYHEVDIYPPKDR